MEISLHALLWTIDPDEYYSNCPDTWASRHVQTLPHVLVAGSPTQQSINIFNIRIFPTIDLNSEPHQSKHVTGQREILHLPSLLTPAGRLQILHDCTKRGPLISVHRPASPRDLRDTSGGVIREDQLVSPQHGDKYVSWAFLVHPRKLGRGHFPHQHAKAVYVTRVGASLALQHLATRRPPSSISGKCLCRVGGACTMEKLQMWCIYFPACNKRCRDVRDVGGRQGRSKVVYRPCAHFIPTTAMNV